MPVPVPLALALAEPDSVALPGASATGSLSASDSEIMRSAVLSGTQAALTVATQNFYIMMTWSLSCLRLTDGVTGPPASY